MSAPITVYSKDKCVQCNTVYRALNKQGVEYEVVNIQEDEQAREYVMSKGHLQAPIVESKLDMFSGYRPDRIKAMCDGLMQSA